MKKLMLMGVILSALLSANAESGPKISLIFIEFFPSSQLVQGASFEIVFNLKNIGDAPINPYAEVTLSGKVFKKDYALKEVDLTDPESFNKRSKNSQPQVVETPVLTVIDKKYNVYNFWPGDATGRQRLYIGALPKGVYTLKLNVDTYSRTSDKNISSDVFEMELFVK